MSYQRNGHSYQPFGLFSGGIVDPASQAADVALLPARFGRVRVRSVVASIWAFIGQPAHKIYADILQISAQVPLAWSVRKTRVAPSKVCVSYKSLHVLSCKKGNNLHSLQLQYRKQFPRRFASLLYCQKYHRLTRRRNDKSQSKVVLKSKVQR